MFKFFIFYQTKQTNKLVINGRSEILSLCNFNSFTHSIANLLLQMKRVEYMFVRTMKRALRKTLD